MKNYDISRLPLSVIGSLRFVSFDVETGRTRRTEPSQWQAGVVCRAAGMNVAFYRDPRDATVYLQRGSTRIPQADIELIEYRRSWALFSSILIRSKTGAAVSARHRFTLLELASRVDITRDELDRENSDPLYYLRNTAEKQEGDNPDLVWSPPKAT